jgi:hypothetical protein
VRALRTTKSTSMSPQRALARQFSCSYRTTLVMPLHQRMHRQPPAPPSPAAATAAHQAHPPPFLTSMLEPAKVRPDPLIPFRVLTGGWHHASHRDHNGCGPPAPLAGACAQGTGSPRREVSQSSVCCLDGAHHGGEHITAPRRLGMDR